MLHNNSEANNQDRKVFDGSPGSLFFNAVVEHNMVGDRSSTERDY